MATFSADHETPGKLLRRAYKASQTAREAQGSAVHVSELIYCLYKAWIKRHKPESMPEPTDEQLILWLSGQGHGAILAAQKDDDHWPEFKYWTCPGNDEFGHTCHPGCAGLERGEIQAHIDLMSWEPYEPWEFKSTRASVKKDPRAWDHYVEQLASYVAIMRIKNPLVGRLFTLHIAFPLAFKGWRIEFDEKELARWRIELWRRYALVTAPQPPDPAENHYEWECAYDCPLGPKGNRSCPGGIGKAAGFFALDHEETSIVFGEADK